MDSARMTSCWDLRSSTRGPCRELGPVRTRMCWVVEVTFIRTLKTPRVSIGYGAVESTGNDGMFALRRVSMIG